MGRKLKLVKWAMALVLIFAGFFTLTKSLQAQADKGSNMDISASKLDQVLAGQEQILKDLAEIKEKVASIQLYTNKL